MKQFWMGILLAALLPVPAWAEVRIAGPTQVARDHLVELKAEGAGGKASHRWKVSGFSAAGAPLAPDVRKNKESLFFVGPPGIYRVELLVVDFDAKQLEEAETTITITDGGTPTPPVPPAPPTPPTPPPTPAPIAAPGFRVLIVEETAERARLTPGQFSAIFGKQVREYLKSHCAKDKENPNGAFRIWDKDVATDSEAKAWQDAMKRPRTAVPWLIISHSEKGGYEGPLPEKLEDTLTLLKKFGGD